MRDAGVKRRIIRMRGFPAEMKLSKSLNLDEGSLAKFRASMAQVPDFSSAFILQASISASRVSRDKNICPTLDEAAWEVFEENREEFTDLATAIEKALHGQLNAECEKLCLRNYVFRLYSKTLRETDFVCTTPVAVANHFSKLFKPTIVFIDEALQALGKVIST